MIEENVLITFLSKFDQHPFLVKFQGREYKIGEASADSSADPSGQCGDCHHRRKGHEKADERTYQLRDCPPAFHYPGCRCHSVHGKRKHHRTGKSQGTVGKERHLCGALLQPV